MWIKNWFIRAHTHAPPHTHAHAHTATHTGAIGRALTRSRNRLWRVHLNSENRSHSYSHTRTRAYCHQHDGVVFNSNHFSITLFSHFGAFAMENNNNNNNEGKRIWKQSLVLRLFFVVFGFRFSYSTIRSLPSQGYSVRSVAISWKTFYSVTPSLPHTEIHSMLKLFVWIELHFVSFSCCPSLICALSPLSVSLSLRTAARFARKQQFYQRLFSLLVSTIFIPFLNFFPSSFSLLVEICRQIIYRYIHRFVSLRIYFLQLNARFHSDSLENRQSNSPIHWTNWK